jgi:hypothetical protein
VFDGVTVTIIIHCHIVVSDRLFNLDINLWVESVTSSDVVLNVVRVNY